MEVRIEYKNGEEVIVVPGEEQIEILSNVVETLTTLMRDPKVSEGNRIYAATLLLKLIGKDTIHA